MKPFQKLQYEFTGNIRDPDGAPAPGDIENRRMEIYRDLLYQNVQSFIAGSFPVLRTILPDERWHELIRDYFQHHRAHTPLFPKMPLEFLHYLEQLRGSRPGDFPFLLELAHYEWIELALSIDARDIDRAGADRHGDLLEGIPVLSPLAWPVAYRFPVHRIRPGFLPDTAPEQPTYLVVYRDEKDNVGFLELNPVAARLMELLQTDSGRSGRALLEQIVTELQHPDPGVVMRGGLEILEQLRQRDVVLGVRIG